MAEKQTQIPGLPVAEKRMTALMKALDEVEKATVYGTAVAKEILVAQPEEIKAWNGAVRVRIVTLQRIQRLILKEMSERSLDREFVGG